MFVPTTPNITAGFFLIVPRSETIELEMSVDEALRYIISMGVAEPPRRRGPRATARDRPRSAAVAENVGDGAQAPRTEAPPSP